MSDSSHPLSSPRPHPRRRARWVHRVTTLALALAVVPGLLAVGSPATATGSGGSGTGAAPRAAARASLVLTCDGDLARSRLKPVLLVPGTTQTPAEFAWNYEKVFSESGRAWCAVTLPDNAMADISVAGKLVARAIRRVHAAAGRRIAVVGHSQGGMVPRWALKYWPDTRAMVGDLVGLAPSNHGTLAAVAACAAGCAPAFWQQRTGSAFLRALNRGPETFRGISYTQVYTATDEVVVPNTPPRPSSALYDGRGRISNVSVQSVCPLEVSDHLSLGTSDPVGYAAVIDAIDHPGPAQPRRFDPTVCLQGIFPGIDPATYPANAARVAATAAAVTATTPRVAAEPPLPAYARRDAAAAR